MSSMNHRRVLLPTVAACLFLVLLVAIRMFPLLECADTCFVDYFEIHDDRIAHFESPDVRLNTWILGWVDHALQIRSTANADLDPSRVEIRPPVVIGNDCVIEPGAVLGPYAILGDGWRV